MLTLANNTYTDNSGLFRMMAIYGGLYYSATSEFERPAKSVSLSEEELTNMCMSLSESSLAKEWENEDDEYWESFLKD